jgi:hypothetical protein
MDKCRTMESFSFTSVHPGPTLVFSDDPEVIDGFQRYTSFCRNLDRKPFLER